MRTVPSFPEIVDIDAEEATSGRFPVFEALTEGAVVLLRGLDLIVQARKDLIVSSMDAGGSQTIGAELLSFYEAAEIPSLDAIHALSQAVKRFHDRREWSRRCHGLFAQLDLPSPILYDGGIPRLLLPLDVVEQARQSGRFEDGDFMRTSPTGKTEFFTRVTPDAMPIHRDYNRDHHLFQVNLWFCLHDTEAEEVIRVFPEHYHDQVFTMECTPEALAQVGRALEFDLEFGDAALFHGEHLHASPVGKPGLRRQSVDFRAAMACPDDNSHYRDGFLNAANFEGVEPAIDLIMELEGETPPTAERLNQIVDIFDSLPFAEDRYLLLAKRAAGVDNAVFDWSLKSVISRSELYFWVLSAGKLAVARNHQGLAKIAAARAYQLAERDGSFPDFMPVAYKSRTQQFSPEKAQHDAAALLAAAG